jgi:hypothetical protein
MDQRPDVIPDSVRRVSTNNHPWHWSRRLGFRFVFLLVLLLVVPFPFDYRGFGGPIGRWWEKLWEPIVPWIATNVLRIDTAFPRFGGAETTWDYIQTGASLVLAVVGAVAWVLIDPRRTDDRRLDQWLRIYLRLFLSTVLFAYGWGKVLPVQFPALGPERLSETFGEASPNGLLWAFMGYSPFYMAFSGAAEVAVGVLISFRRTLTLGALIGIGVMSNVVAMNFAYDVGVKLGSIFYLLALIYLAAPDTMRLANVLVLNRPTQARELSPPVARSFTQRLIVIVPGLLAAFFFARTGVTSWTAAHERGQLAPHPPLYGLYDVESVVRNGARWSLVPNDTTLWSRVAIGQLRSAVRRTSGTLDFYSAVVDTTARSIRFTSRDDRKDVVALAFERADSGLLVLRGRVGGDSTELWLRRRDETRYRLVSHPFHWIQNTAENR